MIPSKLILKSGEVFSGFSPAKQKKFCCGEVVFTTGMTGYVESLTDPSYAGQILTFTYPLIGNYGVPVPQDWESCRIHVVGVVMNALTSFAHHYQAVQTVEEWLNSQRIPFIVGVDTRALTKKLRTEGTIVGAIATRHSMPINFPDLSQRDDVREVSIDRPRIYGKGAKKIIAVDCGMKEQILRSLLEFPLEIKRVPYDYDYTQEHFDGVFLSNGPGDPVLCQRTIAILRQALNRKKPIFGICLGAQLLSLAIGAQTFKLPYGHRGQNQPCEEFHTGKCFLTSQNHGYAILEHTLPSDWDVTFRNLNDGSVEGIAHRSLPFFAVQFHPEAAPGPTDTLFLFRKFYEML